MKKSSLFYLTISSVIIPFTTVSAAGLVNNDPNQNSVNSQSAIDTDELKTDLLRQQSLSHTSPNSSSKNNNDQVARFSGRELVNNPQLLEDLFVEALITANTKLIKTYITLYQNVPNNDKSLIEWGYAIVLRDADLSKSLVLYRSLSKKFPNNDFIRFQLAETLFYNQDFSGAKTEFDTLKSSPSVTPQDKVIFDQYLEAIDKKEKWDFSLSATFLNDKNLGNSAKEGTTVTLPNGAVVTYNSPRQSGHGIGIGFGAAKQWNLQKGKYINFNASSYTKYYWDNKNYNDVTARIGVGFGYANARYNIEVTPYVDKRWYAGGINSSQALKQYSNTYGATLSGSYWFNQKLRYSGFYSFGYEKYNKQIDANQYDGANHILTNTLLYLPSTTQYWSISLDTSKKFARDKTNAYNRIGTRMTWGQEWPLQFATSATLGFAKRHYKEMTFFGTKQKNKEYSVSLSLWNKKLNVAGFTPRLTWSYVKTNSNINIYSYDKKQISVDVIKSF